MATKQTAVKPIKAKTVERAALLQAGYPDMSVAKAQAIIKERSDNPQSWPYEQLERAQAFLAAYEAEPVVVATNPGWKRDMR